MYALTVSRSFKSFSVSYIIIIFLFASLKLLTNFENAYRNPPQNFLLCDWSMFPSADLSLAAGKLRKYELVTGGLKVQLSAWLNAVGANLLLPL